MSVTEPIIRKLTLDWKCFIWNSCLRFQENMTSGLVADTRSQTENGMDRWMEGQTHSPYKALLCLIVEIAE